MAAELMQYRFLVGGGPSSKTWPMWALQAEHRTSVRIRSGCAIINKRLLPFVRGRYFEMRLRVFVAEHFDGMLVWVGEGRRGGGGEQVGRL